MSFIEVKTGVTALGDDVTALINVAYVAMIDDASTPATPTVRLLMTTPDPSGDQRHVYALETYDNIKRKLGIEQAIRGVAL